MMQRYSSYKDSGIQWLGEIPSHWEVKRAKYLFKKEARPTRPGDGIVTCFRDGEVTLRSNRRTTGFTEATDFSNYQGIRKGDLVIHQMDAFAGSTGISDSDGMGTPVLSVCTPKVDYVKSEYFARVIRMMGLNGFIQSLYRGIRERSSDFRFDTFAAQFLPVPSLAEQEGIVAYLTKETEKIDSFISSKEKEIRLLDELKQAEIANAVIRGLHPNVPMKDSGIAWLGQVPEHWEVRRLGRLAKFKTGTTPKFYDDELKAETINWYTPGDFSDEFVLHDSKRRLNKEDFEYNGGCYTPANSILIIGIGGTAGKVACTQELCHMNQQITAIMPNQSIRPLFLVLYLRSLNKTLIETAPYTTLPILNNNFLSKIATILPPIEEQDEIIDYTTCKCDTINKMISNIEQEITQLKEYKQRLIADAVTGQIKVC